MGPGNMQRLTLLACLGVTGHAVQVTVTPACQQVLSGKTSLLQAKVVGSADPACVWTVREGPAGGTIHPDTGRYTAPVTGTILEVRLRATSRAHPEAYAEAQVVVLPLAPFAIVEAVLGPQWLEPYSQKLPFMDQATGLRFGSGATVVEKSPAPDAATTAQWLVAGFGQPVTVQWRAQPGAQGQLLSYREGDQVHRRDITGLDRLGFCARGPVAGLTIEALTGGEDAWKSHILFLPLTVRGLLPFAEGSLQRPCGLARLAPDHRQGQRYPLLVADEGGHSVVAFSAQGEAGTRWGLAAHPGRADGLPKDARFRGPTHLAARVGVPWVASPVPVAGHKHVGCAIADSGNHQIRALDAFGLVTTLAGTGTAGYQDADQPLQAQFNDPRGLALDPHTGTLFVADRGNRVLRAIGPSGEVTTLAGVAGEAGSEDGVGPQARFTDLHGLAYCDQLGLLVVDGHSIRLAEPFTGEVTTLLGVVGTPGQEDATGYPQEPRPCLRSPQAIALCPDLENHPVLLIADQGNHALRELNLMSGSLKTLAGSPGQGRTHWGLLRDGLPGDLDGTYGCLQAPRGVLSTAGAVLVTSGAGLAKAEDRAPYYWNYPDPPNLFLDAPSIAVAQTLGVTFEAHTVERMVAEVRPITYTVDFLNADGTLAERRTDQAMGETLLRVDGSFSLRGTGTVRVRFVTDQGWSSGATRTVEVL